MVLMLSILSFAAAVLVTTYETQYSRFKPFESLLDGEGVLTRLNTEGINEMGGIKGLTEKLDGVKDYEYLLSDYMSVGNGYLNIWLCRQKKERK